MSSSMSLMIHRPTMLTIICSNAMGECDDPDCSLHLVHMYKKDEGKEKEGRGEVMNEHRIDLFSFFHLIRKVESYIIYNNRLLLKKIGKIISTELYH